MIEIPELHHIWHYQAPRSRSHMPRIIPKGRQDVEIFLSGRGFFEQDGRLYEVAAGTVLWHKAGETTIYMADLEDPYACLVVAFEDGHERPVPRISQWKDRASFRGFIDQILAEFLSITSDRRKLACYIYGQLNWQCQAPFDSIHSPHKRNSEMKRITDWIDSHFADNVDLGQLSDLAGISIPHLHTLFKKFTNRSPYQFIQARRLQEAKVLLASTPLAIKEIAHRCGFRDVGNFCRVFKQNNGLTAQEFRLQHLDTR